MDTRSAPSRVTRRVLDAVAALVPDDRRDSVTAFTVAALRRVPRELLRVASTEQVARRLVDAFTLLDRRSAGELAIRAFTPEVAIDGTSGSGSVIQLAAEDRPFLLGTVTDELTLRELSIVRVLHPIVGVERDPDGRISAILPARAAKQRDTLIDVELGDRLDADTLAELTGRLRELVHDVMAATADYDGMRSRVRAVADELRDAPSRAVDPDDSAEAAALLDWLLDDNFVLLGCRDYEIVPVPGGDRDARAVRVRPGSGLGILADEASSTYAEPVPLDALPADLRARLLTARLLTMSRTNRRSTVQRRVRMEYVGIKRLDDDGSVTGEFRLLGLFTRKGLSEPASVTPVLRRTLAQILEREDVVPGSHDEGNLAALFQALPKDELFQADLDTLQTTLVSLLEAEEQHDVRVLTRIDRVTRTVSVVVAVPRDRYSPELRQTLERLFLDRFGGTRVDVELSLIGNRSEALVRFAVAVEGELPEVFPADLQRQVRALTRSWRDEVMAALVRRHGEADGNRLARQVADRLSVAYRARVPPAAAVADIERIARMTRTGVELEVSLERGTGGSTRLRAFKLGNPLELSAFLPILESLGLIVAEELPYRLEGDGVELHVHDFGVREDRGGAIDVDGDAGRIGAAVLAAWSGQLEVDSMNRLVLRAGLPWRDVAILRAYRRFRRQVGTAYTPEYVNDALTHNPEVARLLVELFHEMFSLARPARDDEVAELRRQVLAACDAVERLDHDRILRGFLALIDATLRTNAFRDDAVSDLAGVAVPYLALKFDSGAVPDMPPPTPYREIFVYSPALEGVHLRGGPVARGGLRWSDRKDDLRTEIRGLVKAQMLKNAVIVPTGAKGGFVVKEPGDSTHALRAAVQDQYVTFVRGLLDVTDDVVDGRVTPPPGVRRRDGDDPYLVVAADRGTAALSDVANAVATARGFWLGDAFASGGSSGYDHKALGITARGAWLAVRRHFRELGIDVQAEPIDVVGIGDMSGDVFGNGMLSSRCLRLVAAFDHRDIFLDPEPDPEAAYAERERLFRLGRSSWHDYDPARISAGGGVWARTVKRIPLSDQVRSRLRVDADALSPPELIQAILRAPVDLLFAGGIGTYVKASAESHADVGDRDNDELRVDADALRARVVAEGANLAVTQAARIQFARRGGRINQDAVDNAAGVDISDHEVNVKILLGLARQQGRIDAAERDRLLAGVTDDVVAHVLRDVDLQTWQLSQELARSAGTMPAYEQLMRRLEGADQLDRTVEHLPATAEMDERAAAGGGLTRPELATLMAHVKRVLKERLLASSLPDDQAVQPVLGDYFPPLLMERLGDLLPQHRLRRELIATIVANDVVNRMGITFCFRVAGEAGAHLVDVVRAYWVAREVADADRRWRQVEDTAELLPPERQLEVKERVDDLVAALARVYLGEMDRATSADVIARDRGAFEELADGWHDIGSGDQRRGRAAQAARLADDLVDDGLATFVACARELAMAPDIAAVARELPRPRALVRVADAFLRLSSDTPIVRLERVLYQARPAGRWARWQRAGLAADLRHLRRDAVTAALRDAPDAPELDAVVALVERRAGRLAHADALVREIEQAAEPDLDAVAVAVRATRTALLPDG